MTPGYPERIVCLTEETTETLYLLGEEWRIVGISGFTVRPPRARKEKPKVSAFLSAKIDRILETRDRADLPEDHRESKNLNPVEQKHCEHDQKRERGPAGAERVDVLQPLGRRLAA